MKFSKVEAMSTPKGPVARISIDGKTLWYRYVAHYVSLGDSIAAGHTIDDMWDHDYGVRSQYGVNGNTKTAIVPGSYTDLIRTDLVRKYGSRASATSFARSGDRVIHLLEKLDHDVVQEAIKKADLVTICIGANDVLEPALSHLEDYIDAGDSKLDEIAAIVEENMATLDDDTSPNSYTALFNKLSAINPNAKYVFSTIYNPYKYLWIEEGHHGFFGPIINSIPTIELAGLDIDSFIKDSLLGTPAVKMLFNRVNGLCDWAEKYVSMLNNVLRNKIRNYGKPNFLLADTKEVFDSVPDRPVSSPKHYNDLVSVEYTRDYDTAKMDWGRLWEGSDVATFWWNLARKYVSTSGIYIEGFASDLVQQMIEKVIVPDIDPHPESYGHYALKRSFEDALKRSFDDTLDWASLTRHTITFNANGGSGTMSQQKVVALDGMAGYTNIAENAFTFNIEGYYFAGWNTAADGSATAYSNGQFIGVTGDLSFNAQWSNMYCIIYRHSNHTNLYDDNNTGHQECYALSINGVQQRKLSTFANDDGDVYWYPYGTLVKVEVSNYNDSELWYDDVDCDVYWNGTSVSKGYRETEYEFSLGNHIDIDFQWEIAGSLLSLDMQSWWDCYIRTL